MAREAQWYQFLHTDEFNDENLHSAEIGTGVLDQPGITVVRMIGRLSYWYVSKDTEGHGAALAVGILMTGGQVDPVTQINGVIAGQRWKWWSQMVSVPSGVATSAGQQETSDVDRVDFDVRGMQKSISGEEWRIVYKMATGSFLNDQQAFTAAIRVCYLLPT